jgi:hypothetical protein
MFLAAIRGLKIATRLQIDQAQSARAERSWIPIVIQTGLFLLVALKKNQSSHRVANVLEKLTDLGGGEDRYRKKLFCAYLKSTPKEIKEYLKENMNECSQSWNAFCKQMNN